MYIDSFIFFIKKSLLFLDGKEKGGGAYVDCILYDKSGRRLDSKDHVLGSLAECNECLFMSLTLWSHVIVYPRLAKGIS